MNPVTVMLLAGGLTGLGTATIMHALFPKRPALAEAMLALSQPAPPALPRRARLDAAMARPLQRFGLPKANTLRDLGITDRDPAAYLAGQLAIAVVATLGGAVLPLAWGAGGQTPLWLGILAGLTAIRVQAMRLRTAAAARRRHMRHTLSAILDLAGGALAGGAGIEQALTDALDNVVGWAAQRIRRELSAADQTRGRHRIRIPQALHTLAEQIGVDELAELAITIDRASAGAPVAESMTALAHTVRTRLTDEMERHANANNAKLALPIILFGLGYLIFLLYGALGVIRSGLTP